MKRLQLIVSWPFFALTRAVLCTLGALFALHEWIGEGIRQWSDED